MLILPSGLPELIGADEDLARFLTQSSQFTKVMVKPAAFLPSSSGETSVSRAGPEIFGAAVGDRACGRGQTDPIRSRHLKAAAVTAPLRVDADEPPPCHAALRGWPVQATDPQLQKAQRKRLAEFLAIAAGAPVFIR